VKSPMRSVGRPPVALVVLRLEDVFRSIPRDEVGLTLLGKLPSVGDVTSWFGRLAVG
jgi:hypothetical protein